MKKLVVVVFFWLAVLNCNQTGQQVATGCAPAPPRGFDVAIRDEFALITWDPHTKIEHFTRVASFDTQAPDLGFLVPTPSEPTLTEVDADGIRRTLSRQTKARTRYEHEYITKFGLGPWPKIALPDTAALPEDNSVRVLGQFNLAGYEASILQAEESSSLKAWLDENDYPTSDSLAEWLAIYTEKDWFITAFKLTSEDSNGDLGKLNTKAIRMSFTSEQPFYPYREPATEEPLNTTNLRAPRSLKVFLLSDGRYEGHIGRDIAWPGRIEFSAAMESYYLRDLQTNLKTDSEQLPNWLTEFTDSSSPRQGIDDLYFSRSPTQEEVRRPDIVKVITHDRFVPGWTNVFIVILALVVLTPLGIVARLIYKKAQLSGKLD
ncbi:MAG: DUF2330 domain-containing protein [Planctomycetota bacterium]